MRKRQRFEGKSAIVTGGASGIGLALVRALLAKGAKVVLTDRNTTGIDAALAEPRPIGSELTGECVDVRDPLAVDRVVAQTVRRYGMLDFMFNNAGVGIAGEFRDLTAAHWEPVMATNFQGVLNGTVAAYQVMAAQGQGHIVNVGSLGGLTPFPGSIPYAASKYAVVGLTTSLRAEAAGLGVRVSVVCPGPVKTGMLAATSFVNVDREKAMKAFPIAPIAASVCADRILRGVARNKPIIVVTPFAWFNYILYRIAPELVLRLNERFFASFRAARLVDTPTEDRAVSTKRGALH